MIRLLCDILRGKRRKYTALLLCVAVCSFFTMAVDTMYRGYCDAQIVNAYEYGGNWDISIRILGSDVETYKTQEKNSLEFVGMNTVTYSLQLEKVPEDKVYGTMKEYVTHYYLGLWGIQSEQKMYFLTVW